MIFIEMLMTMAAAVISIYIFGLIYQGVPWLYQKIRNYFKPTE